MSQPLQDLLRLLQLEKIEEGLYRGQSEHIGLQQVYGGQVIGQALSAARYTVDETRSVHSFHSYFLYRGDPEKPIIYDVDNIRDGRSFSTRRVKALQNGRPIFYLTASYHVPEAGFEHQLSQMPDVAAPETLMNEVQLARRLADQLPASVADIFCREKPIEFRPVNVVNPLKPEKVPARQCLWIKANGEVPDNQLIQQYMLAYASDWGFLRTALNPHGVSLFTPKLQIATIDHSVWFHRPFKMDEWLLFSVESPIANNTRGFVRGEFFNQQGQLVASAVQEGVIRYKKPTTE